MPGQNGENPLKQSGLNAAWFTRYEHTCKKYGAAIKESKQLLKTPSPMLDMPVIRKRKTPSPTKLPPIDSPGEAPEESGRKKGPPKVQVRQGPAYVQPARLRTFEARLCKKVTATADPYNPEVRRISLRCKMSAKRIEELHRVFLAASKGRRTLDLPAFRRLMASLGQKARAINDRMFEIYDLKRDKKMTFEAFCVAVLTFKSGSHAEQASVLFKIIDVSDDRMLSKFELLKFFCSGISDKGRKRAMSDVVNELMSLIDEDGSGEVDYEEFVHKVANDDDVWMMFDAISPFSTMKEKLNNFKFDPIDHSEIFDDGD